MSSAFCIAWGLNLYGVDDYAVIILNLRWGETTSFEVLVKFDKFKCDSRVFI